MFIRKIIRNLSIFCLSVALLLPSFSAFAATGAGLPSADRVYFFNIAGGGAPDGDFIIVESEGHFGLIDTGHRFENTIEDADGTVYTAESSRSLSCQIHNKNGRDAAQYMIDSLGVTHLDFIVGTHAHSDHIGGVPEIAALTFTDENGEERHLVDSDTVYIYKQYQHINDLQDDIKITKRSVAKSGAVDTSSWHNQAFAYQAVSSMQAQGCALAELSNDVHISSDVQPTVDYHETVMAINGADGLSGARYYRGAVSNYYDDFVIFRMGKLSIRLYNLFMTDDAIDENVNSLVAVITDGSTKVVSLADINVEHRTEQQIAQAIYDDLGTADLVKAAHHGAYRGSNSRGMLDALQPKNIVITRSRDYADGSVGRSAFAAATVYAKLHYNTAFYENGASDYGIAAEFGKGRIDLYNLSGVGRSVSLTSAKRCLSTSVPLNGWSHWTVEMGNPDIEELCYLENGVQIAHWYEDDNHWWYYIDEHSQYYYGWHQLDGRYYYFAVDSTQGYPLGAMVTGWNYIDGKWYCFDDSGRLAKGWTKLPEGWYYFNEDDTYLKNGWHKIAKDWYYFDTAGIMQTGLLKVSGKQYYLESDGKMRKGWLKLAGNWYYFGSDGAMTVGWKKISNGWYYFNADGTMATGWLKSGGKWYYFEASGLMAEGWQKVDGVWYYFDTSGAMKTGWLKDGSKWYYFNASGAMKTGWLQQGSKWYYFDGSGAMATGTKTISGKQYTFDANGVWVK